jgi:hypothetical protein
VQHLAQAAQQHQPAVHTHQRVGRADLERSGQPVTHQAAQAGGIGLQGRAGSLLNMPAMKA